MRRTWVLIVAVLVLTVACASNPTDGVVLADDPPTGAQEFARSLVDRALDDGVPGVSVAIVDADGLLATAVGGVADAETGAPVTVDTRFHAGSTHKALNAFFVATLVDDGLLDWDDDVVDLLDDPGVGPGITLADLLSMTGGIPDDAEDDIGERALDDGPIDELAFEAIGASEPLGDPGEVFEYSNLSASLAGYAAAGVDEPTIDDTHAAYVQAFGDRVLAPLGMDDTDLLASEAQASGELSRSHEVVDGEMLVLDSVDLDDDVLLPSGGLKTTATDLGRFLTVMLQDGGGIVSPGQIERMWTPVLDGYGLGWQIVDDSSAVRFHEGAFDGFLSVIAVAPDSGVGLVLLANTETTAEDLVEEAPELLAAWGSSP